MTPEDHYQEAERLLRWLDVAAEVTSEDVACVVAALQAATHALLAHAGSVRAADSLGMTSVYALGDAVNLP